MNGYKIYHVFSVKTSDRLHNFSILRRKHIFPVILENASHSKCTFILDNTEMHLKLVPKLPIFPEIFTYNPYLSTGRNHKWKTCISVVTLEMINASREALVL